MKRKPSIHSSCFDENGEPQDLLEVLRRRGSQHPDRVAYTFLVDAETTERNLTYRELDQRASTIADYLQALDAPGKTVLLLYPPGLEFIASFFGCMYGGVVAIPAYPPKPNRVNRALPRLHAIIRDAKPAAVLTTSSILSLVQGLVADEPDLQSMKYIATDTIDGELAAQWDPPDITSDTVAFLQYTSGSTAIPKGVMVTHGNLLHNERMIQTGFQSTEESTLVSWLPFYHDMGLIGNILQSMFIGARCILMSPVAFLERPLRWLQCISRYRAVISGAPNFAFDLCVRKITSDERSTLDLSSWRIAFNGAEPVRKQTVSSFASTFRACGFREEAFYPCYGLAEATLLVTGGHSSEIPVINTFKKSALERGRMIATGDEQDDTLAMVGCGQSLLGQQIIIVNPHTLTRCDGDQVGEIWVSGRSITKGYWNRADQTKETFNAYVGDTGEGPFLRTGDMGFLKDGELFITGRLKDLIIIRGLNHYPQDIELTVERCHSALRPGCGAAFSINLDGEERVVAIQEVGRRQNIDLNTLVDTIRQTVAEYHELQVHAVVLIRRGTIPKTSSGKIQRSACRAMFLEKTLEVVAESVLASTAGEKTEAFSSEELLQAMTAVERQELIESRFESQISRLLCREEPHLDRHKPLSKLGFDSLMAAELSALISKDLPIDVSPLELLQSTGIANLASQVLTLWDAARGNRLKTEAGSRGQRIPRHDSLSPTLSFAQRRLWFLDQLMPGSAYYNIPVAVRLSGPLDARTLERSLREIVERHETLRTTFSNVGGSPVQIIHPSSSFTMDLSNLEKLPEDVKWAETRRLAAEEGGRLFDLAEGPLIRARVLRLDQTRHVLIVNIHHIVADGWSVGLLLKEMAALYESYSMGTQPVIDPLPIQYADYAEWQRSWLAGELLSRQMEYWKKELGGNLPVLQLPTDRPRPPVQTFRGARYSLALPKVLTDSIKQLGRNEGCTLFMTLMAAFNALLYRYTNQRDISVGTAIHGRNRAEIRELIGFFANTLILRTQFSGRMSFRQLLRCVRDNILGAYAHQDIPFEKLVEELEPDRDSSYTPLFQVMFILQNDLNVPADDKAFAGITIKRSYELENTGTCKRDLTLYLIDEPEGLTGLFEYDMDLFDESTIARMTAHFGVLLEAIVADPELFICDLPLLTKSERRQLLVEWNHAKVDCNDYSVIHEIIEAQVERTPDGAAVVFDGEQLSYQELNRRANQLGHYLQTLGVGPEVLVGICIERSLEMVVGVLGVLKAGGAYLPLDATYPNERLAFMLEDAQAGVLLVREESGAIPLPQRVQRVCFETDWPRISRMSDENPKTAATRENSAYLIYTSGSTGDSKGVVVTHGSLCHYVQSIRAPLGLTCDDRYLHTASIAFSSSVRQLMTPLSTGAAVVIAGFEQIADPMALFDLVKRQRVTVMDIVPTYWRSCNRALADMEDGARIAAMDNRLRLLLSASEPLSSDLSREWKFGFGHGARLINMFGQTETTGIVSTHPYDAADDDSMRIIPIGRPLANTEVYLLDDNLSPVPIGAHGQIYIGGRGLCRGYLKRPDLTAEKFIPNPFNRESGARLYKTGDLGRYLPNGDIEFLGRTDYQVKIRGIRIEPAEVETVLASHPAVREAVVIARDDDSGRKYLAGFVVPDPERSPSITELRSFLRKKLPEFMVPSKLVLLEALPLTLNGKLDRRALPVPEPASDGSAASFVAPANPIERRVAEIWAELLGVEPVGANDNFFDLGGHSLIATQIISRARDAFSIDIPLHTLFEEPTVANLARTIERAGASDTGGGIQPIPRGAGNIDHLLADIASLSRDEVMALLNSESPER